MRLQDPESRCPLNSRSANRSRAQRGNWIKVVVHMAREQIYEALRVHPFTRGLSEPQLVALANIAREVTFQEDEVIFRAGARSRNLYLLVSGSVCVELSTPVYAVCIQALGPGEAFGWSSLTKHPQTIFQVRARERSTALRLDASQASAAWQENPELGLELLQRILELVAERVKAVESRLAEFMGHGSSLVRPAKNFQAAMEACPPQPEPGR